jgi:hypothetical protein
MPQEPIIRRTTDHAIFKSMDLASLLINRKTYISLLKNPRYVDDWPAMNLGKQLVEDELSARGIEVPKEA